MKHKLLLLYTWFVRTVLFFLPDVPFIMRFRGWLYGLGMKRCGKDFQVTHDVRINGLEDVCIGNHVFLGNNTIIITHPKSGVIIDNEVLVGPHCIIVDGNHGLTNGSYRYSSGRSELIILHSGGWIGANCCVLAGAELPKASVLAAGGILNKKQTIPFGVYAGCPAKLVTICKEQQ